MKAFLTQLNDLIFELTGAFLFSAHVAFYPFVTTYCKDWAHSKRVQIRIRKVPYDMVDEELEKKIEPVMERMDIRAYTSYIVREKSFPIESEE